MVDTSFERRLERLFSESPELPDCAEFAEKVERRLNRGWMARRWLIGAAGLVGGVIGASQLVMSNLGQRMESAEGAARALGAGLSQIEPGAEMVGLMSGGIGLWVALGLAVLTMGVALNRVIEEI